LTVIVMVISSTAIHFSLLVALLALGTTIFIGVRWQTLVRQLAQPLIIAFFLLLLRSLAGSEPLTEIHLPGYTLVVYADGLHAGLLMAARVLAGASVVLLLVSSTSFTELMGALSWYRIPQGVVETTLFAWRALFLLFDDAQLLYAAQKNRLGYVGYRQGLRSFGTLAGALVIKAFDNSQTLTTAMVQRGYDGNLPLLRHKPLRMGQLLATLLVIAAFGLVWFL
jgi:cobalt/nickel transport system permease protein